MTDNRNGLKIDLSRNLCDNCSKFSLDEECKYLEANLGEFGNVARCPNFVKINENLNRWRSKVGGEYFSYILKDENISMKQFKPNRRVENETRIDDLYYEIGNYFRTEEECINNYKQFEQ